MTDSDKVEVVHSSVRWSAIVGLAIAFGWVLIPLPSTHQLTNAHDDVVNICVKWIVVLVLGVVAFGFQRQRASELGILGLRWRDVAVAFAGAIIAFILSAVVSRLVAIPSSLSNLREIAALPLTLRIGVVLSAAICEEFMYRGFAIEELAMLTRNRWLAGAISLVLFTVSHIRIYGFSPSLLVPGTVGAVLTGVYLWRRNLPSCMLLHAIIDGFFLLLLPALVHAK